MEEIIKLNGTLSQVNRQLQSYGIALNEEETAELISAILKNKEYLQPDEKAASKMIMPHIPTGCLGLITMSYNYHISIKKLTLCTLAFVADKLTWGISSAILNAFGISNNFKAINSIDEAEGEKCIVKETVLYNNKIGNVNILDKFNGECCNNNLHCKFKRSDKCNCTKLDIKEIFERLVKKEIFKKIETGYKLNW